MEVACWSSQWLKAIFPRGRRHGFVNVAIGFPTSTM